MAHLLYSLQGEDACKCPHTSQHLWSLGRSYRLLHQLFGSIGGGDIYAARGIGGRATGIRVMGGRVIGPRATNHFHRILILIRIPENQQSISLSMLVCAPLWV